MICINENRVYSTGEAANLLDITVRSMLYRIKKGKIEAFKPDRGYRIHGIDLKKYYFKCRNKLTQRT